MGSFNYGNRKSRRQKIENHAGRKYKVTRRMPELSIAETKILRSKKKAIKKFEGWLK
ncbi:MAG: hypothetical protein KKG60_00695 [Nanoarchaeota archaeon]|nr:hypothetical protein [Nanoarchaeota archaeon]